MKVALEYLLKAFFQVNNFLPYSKKDQFCSNEHYEIYLSTNFKKSTYICSEVMSPFDKTFWGYEKQI